MKNWKIALIGMGLLLINASAALAHVVFIEDQARDRNPIPDTGDYSFFSPFNLDLKNGGVQSSAAIFAYLTPNDVDVFSFTVKSQFPPIPTVVAASALAPACAQTVSNYPLTALIGPASNELPLPNDDLLDKLPPSLRSQIPEGYGVILANNPPVEPREIFYSDLESGLSKLKLNLSWFLPEGLTQDCLLSGNCTPENFRNTISTAVTLPGTYYIAMWNPTGQPIDYTANIGFQEDLSNVPDPEIVKEIKNNKLLHTPCSIPYPGNSKSSSDPNKLPKKH
ncbi:hypothetical protein ACE1AT_05530 [Pelatocladus sp. BLCC-F211]|uniref:hypothetical protein n=1 Tax=Pelatocladus sp. BLCC-F211 TaxID=3342752 RepID=UPI0035B830C9